MALSSLAIQYSNAQATGATISAIPLNNYTATSIGILAVVYDNTGGGGADGFTSCVDTLGNTWTARVTRVNDPGAASAGSVLRIFTCSWNVSPITNTDTVTFTNGATMASVIFLTGVDSSLGTATYVTGNSASGNGTTQTITSTSIPTNDFIFGVLGQEGNGTRSGASSNVNGTWTTPSGSAGGSLGAGTTLAGQEGIIQQKLVTGTGTQIFNPTATPLGDWNLGWIQITETISATSIDPFGMMGYYGL